MTKEQEIMNFLIESIFNPILNSPEETPQMKQGVNIAISRIENLNAEEMIAYFWESIIGLERSTLFAKFVRKKEFVDAVNEFGEKFNDEWLAEEQAGHD